MLTERILCLLIVLPGAAALFYSTHLWKGEWNKGMFVYYTNQSNLLVVVFHALLCGASFTPQGGLYRFLSAAPVRLAVTCCITVTLIVYHFILVPSDRARDPEGFKRYYYGFVNLTVHYAVPLLTVLCWLLTADKNAPWWSAAAWLCLPMAYMVYALLRGKYGGTITGKPDSPRYPYPFLDADSLGPKDLVKNCAIYMTAFFLLGAAFTALAKGLEKLG